MKIVPKFKHIWMKMVIRRGFAIVGFHPFPGSSPLRWAIFNSKNHLLRYEGKPSRQALEIAVRTAGFTGNTLVEFDRLRPFLTVQVDRQAGCKFELLDVETWKRYHGADVSLQKHYRKIFEGKSNAL